MNLEKIVGKENVPSAEKTIQARMTEMLKQVGDYDGPGVSDIISLSSITGVPFSFKNADVQKAYDDLFGEGCAEQTVLLHNVAGIKPSMKNKDAQEFYKAFLKPDRFEDKDTKNNFYRGIRLFEALFLLSGIKPEQEVIEDAHAAYLKKNQIYKVGELKIKTDIGPLSSDINRAYKRYQESADVSLIVGLYTAAGVKPKYTMTAVRAMYDTLIQSAFDGPETGRKPYFGLHRLDDIRTLADITKTEPTKAQYQKMAQILMGK